jgi:hypothetical protein
LKYVYEKLKKNRSIKAVKLFKSHQGHRQGLWRDSLADGLKWLLNKKEESSVNAGEMKSAKVGININVECFLQDKFTHYCKENDSVLQNNYSVNESF